MASKLRPWVEAYPSNIKDKAQVSHNNVVGIKLKAGGFQKPVWSPCNMEK